MPAPVTDPQFWRERLLGAKELHHAVYVCTLQRWQQIERRHRYVLRRCIRPMDSVLDVGCGWGRLLGMMPRSWYGPYLGVDLSPDFIQLARQLRPERNFLAADCRTVETPFDWAILVSVRKMLMRETDVWPDVEAHLRRVCKRLLVLEYENVPESAR